MSLANVFEWNLNSIKRWYCTDRITPMWCEKEKITSIENNLTLKHLGSRLIIKHNNEPIEVIAIPVPGKPASLTVRIGPRRDSVAIYTEDKNEDRRMGLSFAASADRSMSAVQNCAMFIQDIKRFVSVKETGTVRVYNTQPVKETFQQLMSGQTPVEGFPAGEFLPPGFPIAEAFATAIADPRFPHTMAAVHECFEALIK